MISIYKHLWYNHIINIIPSLLLIQPYWLPNFLWKVGWYRCNLQRFETNCTILYFKLLFTTRLILFLHLISSLIWELPL